MDIGQHWERQSYEFALLSPIYLVTKSSLGSIIDVNISLSSGICSDPGGSL